MTTLTHYVGSNGVAIAFADMAWPHLNSAIAKLERTGADPAMLDALLFHKTQRPAYDPDNAPPPRERREAPPAPIGDNHPPEDPFADELRERHAQLLNEIAEHELQASVLPQTVQSDEDVAKITAWVVGARRLYRTAEGARETAKAPFLTFGKTVDGLFNGLKDNLTSRAREIEARSAAYLKAKAIAEQAARDEAARKAREAQAEADRKEREAQAERDRLEREARQREQEIRDAADAKSRAAAELAAREANERARDAAREAERKADEAAKANKVAEKAEKRADGIAQLERTDAGGGAAKLVKVPKYRVADGVECTLSLGPLGRYLSQSAIEDALARAAKDIPQPKVPGVIFWEEETVATHATKS